MTLNNQNSQRSNGGGSDNGNAQRNYARYIMLAKDAASRGDRIESENLAINTPNIILER